jgi:hypothetical protein
MAPQGAVLEQDPLSGVVDQEPGGTKPTPEASAVALDPGITRIAGTQMVVRIARQRWCEE